MVIRVVEGAGPARALAVPRPQNFCLCASKATLACRALSISRHLEPTFVDGTDATRDGPKTDGTATSNYRFQARTVNRFFVETIGSEVKFYGSHDLKHSQWRAVRSNKSVDNIFRLFGKVPRDVFPRECAFSNFIRLVRSSEPSAAVAPACTDHIGSPSKLPAQFCRQPWHQTRGVL